RPPWAVAQGSQQQRTAGRGDRRLLGDRMHGHASQQSRGGLVPESQAPCLGALLQYPEPVLRGSEQIRRDPSLIAGGDLDHGWYVPNQRTEQVPPGRAVGPENFGRPVEAAIRHGGAAIVERLSVGDLGVAQLDTAGSQIEGAEER